MFRILTERTLQWHRGHHSGDSIDKVNKAANALEAFFDSTFEVSYMILRLVGAQIILFFYLPQAGWASMGASVIAVGNVLLFDRVLFEVYKKLNDFSNHAGVSRARLCHQYRERDHIEIGRASDG